jgi:hypothetical protein
MLDIMKNKKLQITSDITTMFLVIEISGIFPKSIKKAFGKIQTIIFT